MSLGDAEAVELVKGQLERAIRNFRGSRDYFRRRSLIESVVAAGLSAVTTLLIGLNELYDRSFLVAASLATAGLATLAASWIGWRPSGRMSHANYQALVGLWALRDRIEYETARYGSKLPADAIDGYHRELLDVIAEANVRLAKTVGAG
jgi:hypothetical protein